MAENLTLAEQAIMHVEIYVKILSLSMESQVDSSSASIDTQNCPTGNGSKSIYYCGYRKYVLSKAISRSSP